MTLKTSLIPVLSLNQAPKRKPQIPTITNKSHKTSTRTASLTILPFHSPSMTNQDIFFQLFQTQTAIGVTTTTMSSPHYTNTIYKSGENFSNSSFPNIEVKIIFNHTEKIFPTVSHRLFYVYIVQNQTKQRKN